MSRPSPSPPSLGAHWLADAQGCRADALSDLEAAARLLRELAAGAHLHALDVPHVRRTPAGLVGILLLAESHASVHTDAALGTAFVDVFSCTGLGSAVAEFERSVRALFRPERLSMRIVARGPA